MRQAQPGHFTMPATMRQSGLNTPPPPSPTLTSRERTVRTGTSSVSIST